MSRPEQPAEPTMEEILASIRRAIDEDTRLDTKLAGSDGDGQAARAPAESFAAPVGKASSGSDVLELRRPVAAQDSRPAASSSHFSASFERPVRNDAKGDEMPSTTPQQPYGAPANDRSAASVEAENANGSEPLLAENTDAAVAAAFRELSEAIALRLETDAVVEDAVREILRPMLKEWLDAKLPGLVKGLVREEIERILRLGGDPRQR